MENMVDQGTVIETAPNNGVTNSNSEKTFTQGEMNEILRLRLNEDRQKRESNSYSQSYSQTPSNQSRSLSEEDIRRIQDEHLNKRLTELQTQSQEQFAQQESNRIWNNVANKFESAKKKYEDFEQEVGTNVVKEFGAFPNVLTLLSDHVHENAEEVIYELGKSGSKLTNLELCAAKDPQKALKDVNKLIKSIKQNEEAKNIRVPNQPLSQNKPSIHTVGSISKDQPYDWEGQRKRFRA